MTFLRVSPIKTLLQKSTVQYIRCYSDPPPWFHIWKPGPYPKTKAERLAAAKKYGIPIGEYKRTDDIISGLGDYPALPKIGSALKDPYYPYDYPELRLNYQEPIPENLDMMDETRCDYGERQRIRPYIQWLQFIGAVSLLSLLAYYAEKAPMFHSVAPKQYPGEGIIHYTFEPNDVVSEDEPVEDDLVIDHH